MNTYMIELFKAGEYQETRLVFVIEDTERRPAVAAIRKTGSFDHLNAFAGKKISAKQAATLAASGATDMRQPKVATVAMRKTLGALVGM